jgi:hypothetical protein
MSELFPTYAPSLERARTSFRPAEIAGREYSPRHDDRLLHVDAFPSRPLRGKRILRLFSNVAADGSVRDWRVGEPFAEFARNFLPIAGPALPGRPLLEWLGLTKGRRSEYDRITPRLRPGKQNAGYQVTAPRRMWFAAGTTWLCFTDQVLHAALAGHCALEQTFHLPVAAGAPERLPLRVLEDCQPGLGLQQSHGRVTRPPGWSTPCGRISDHTLQDAITQIQQYVRSSVLNGDGRIDIIRIAFFKDMWTMPILRSR